MTVVVIPGGLLPGPRPIVPVVPVVPVTPVVVYPVNPNPVVITRPVIVTPPSVIVEPPVEVISAPPVAQREVVVIPAGGTSAAVIPADANTALRVTERVLDGPAARAGVQLGDIIIRVSGKRVKTADDLQAALAAGRKVEVTYFDAENNKVETKPMVPDGGSLGVTVEMTAVDLEEDAAPVAPPAPPVDEPLPAGTVPALQVTEVTDRGPAARAGLQVGDVILTVGGKKVDSPAALGGALKAGGEVEVLFFNPEDGKAETRKVKVANGGIGAAVRVVALAEK